MGRTMNSPIRWWSNPLRRLLRVDCRCCVRGQHRICEKWHNTGCYCRIIKQHG